MSSASGMCQAYPVYTSGAPEDVSTALHGSGEGSLCTKVHAARGTPLYVRGDFSGGIGSSTRRGAESEEQGGNHNQYSCASS